MQKNNLCINKKKEKKTVKFIRRRYLKKNKNAILFVLYTRFGYQNMTFAVRPRVVTLRVRREFARYVVVF